MENNDRLMNWFARAQECFQSGQDVECRTWIDRIIEVNPHHPQARELWPRVDARIKEQGQPYIFPAGLGQSQSVDGIPGYLSRGDIMALQYCALNSSGKSVNIGIFNGLSTYVIAKENPNLEVYGVDAFLGMTAQLSQINEQQAQRARTNLDRLANAHLVVGLSEDVASSWEEQLGFVFIDGDHSAHGAVSDFEAWAPFVVAGGLIAIHDTYGRVSESIIAVRKSYDSHGPDIVSQMMAEHPDYEFVLVNGSTEVWRKKSAASKGIPITPAPQTSAATPGDPNTHKYSKLCPETCIVFVSYGRPAIAQRSFNSLMQALQPFRERVRVIISDASDDPQKMEWARQSDADDVILTPRFTPAATSRNLASTLILDKYSPQYICMLEDDFEYSPDWYAALVDAATRLYGVLSPLNLAYGIFSACDHHIPAERKMEDTQNEVTAYIFGAVAYQRFVPTHHYLSVMRTWDADLLGISYAQTGGQTFRNTMRGFCGAVLPGQLSRPLDINSSDSTWSKGKRHPGPAAHSFELGDYEVIRKAASNAGCYEK